MTRIKIIYKGQAWLKPEQCTELERGGCLFTDDPACRDYDWAVVYDEFPTRDAGSIRNGREPLACPQEHTILVTCEPPSIKIYPRIYTEQFGYVITTHSPRLLPHPHHVQSRGALWWMANYPLAECFAMPSYEKTCGLSTVCSSKQQKHTLHYARYRLTAELAKRLPEMDWYGHGVKKLDFKYEALSPYRYHLAVENYIAPHHWTDKITDPLLAHCLTFYAGDPCLGELLPPESFIPVPIDDPAETYGIIRSAMENGEYEKRLPAILEARRRIIERYNFYNQIAELVHAHTDGAAPAAGAAQLISRHALRRTPVGAMRSVWAKVQGAVLLKCGIS